MKSILSGRVLRYMNVKPQNSFFVTHLSVIGRFSPIDLVL